MRISTSQIFDQNLAAMLQQQTAVANTQNQVSTGKRIINPSDDPAGSVQILNLQRELSLTQQYSANATVATNKLQSEESTLTGAANVLQRIRELSVQALNATNSANDRKAISTEIKQLNDQLLNLANTRDANGDYLFAGFASGTQPYESLLGSYRGDEGQRNLSVGPGVLVASNDAGNQVFEASLTAVTKDISTEADITFTPAPLGAGTSTAAFTVNDESLVPETFASLTFTYAAGPPEQYTITDGTNSVVVPYVDGDALQLETLDPNFPPFNITLSGVPEDGDEFDLSSGVVGNGQLTIVDNSFVGERFSPLTFNYSEGPPAEYSVSDGVNTETFAYQSGMQIKLANLNGAFPSLTVSLSGTPNDGDEIRIEKAVVTPNQTIFKTINDFALALDANNVSPDDSPNNGDFLTNLDAVLARVIDVRSQIGGRLNAIEQQVNVNENLEFNIENNLSQIKDLDYAEAISTLTRQITSLQAAQQTFTRVQNLSLFNFL